MMRISHEKKSQEKISKEKISQEKISQNTYQIMHQLSQKIFIKDYNGEWDRVSKKAWRDLKSVVGKRSNDSNNFKFEIIHLATQESRLYNFENYAPQKPSYNKERNEKYANLYNF